MTKLTAKFDRDSIINDDIRSLQIDAGQHGDSALVADCDAALEGDSAATERCIDAFEKAWKNAQ